MKNKLAITVLALLCIIACAFGLTACDDGGVNRDDGKTTTGLVAVDEAGTEYTEYDFGDIMYGQTPNFGSFKLYVKYADGTKRELSGEDGDDIKIEYSYNHETLPDAPARYDVGLYGIRYEFENNSVYVSYRIVTSATATPYSINLDKLQWKYGEEPTITVRHLSQDVVDSSKYTAYYIEKDEYDKIKDADNFTEQLQQKADVVYANTGDGMVFVDIDPGEYYFFAIFDGYVRANSTLQKVTINKGTLKPIFADDFSGFYFANNWWPSGEVGKIKISQIVVNINYSELSWETESGKPYTSSFDVRWRNPDEEIDSTIDGKTRFIKFVFGDDRYEDYLYSEPLRINFEKYRLDVPSVGDSQMDHTITYDGQTHDILLLFNGSVVDSWNKLYQKVLTIKDGNGNVVALGDDGKLATVTDEGNYTFTLELKDKVNYEWVWRDYSQDDYPMVYDTADKTFEFTVRPILSWVNPFPDRNYYNLSIDEHRQLVLKVVTGTVDDYTNGSSPYKAGTLQAELMSVYLESEGSSPVYPTIDATVTVESRADGYDYIIITVTDFKEVANNASGNLILHITAEGDNHYADIDRVFGYVSISRYSYADISSVTCPLKGQLTGDTMEQPAGITVAELYKKYPELTNDLGKWSLEYDYGNTGDWTPLGDSAALPQTTLKCRLVFKSNFVNNVNQIAVYEFTLIGTPNN